MCWSVPGKIIDIKEKTAKVEIAGIQKNIMLDLLPEVVTGDYVLVHAGYAIKKVDKEKASFTIDFFKGNFKNA